MSEPKRGDEGGEVFVSQPNVLIGRSANSGSCYFRVQVLAADRSEDAIRRAKAIAEDIFRELDEIYGRRS